MKKIIIALIGLMFLITFFLGHNGMKLPFDINLDQVEEINVDTNDKEGTYELDEEWTQFIDLVMDFEYKSISESELEKFEEVLDDEEELYRIVIECDEDIYRFILFKDILIANYINEQSDESEELQFYIAKHEDIEALIRELSELDFLLNKVKIEKPVIYLYPEKEMDIKVSIKPEPAITTSYPKYDKGWLVRANPSGRIQDKAGKDYAYLYWEGHITLPHDFKQGFIVHKKNLINFLESKLEILGLNYREKNDFITYWLPSLEKYEYNKIQFFTEEINEWVELEVSPRPQTLVRVYMVFEQAEASEKIKEQKLKQLKRQGYTVVEWGGCEISTPSFINDDK